eukprot:170392_1
MDLLTVPRSPVGVGIGSVPRPSSLGADLIVVPPKLEGVSISPLTPSPASSGSGDSARSPFPPDLTQPTFPANWGLSISGQPLPGADTPTDPDDSDNILLAGTNPCFSRRGSRQIREMERRASDKMRKMKTPFSIVVSHLDSTLERSVMVLNERMRDITVRYKNYTHNVNHKKSKVFSGLRRISCDVRKCNYIIRVENEKACKLTEKLKESEGNSKSKSQKKRSSFYSPRPSSMDDAAPLIKLQLSKTLSVFNEFMDEIHILKKNRSKDHEKVFDVESLQKIDLFLTDALCAFAEIEKAIRHAQRLTASALAVTAAVHLKNKLKKLRLKKL